VPARVKVTTGEMGFRRPIIGEFFIAEKSKEKSERSATCGSARTASAMSKEIAASDELIDGMVPEISAAAGTNLLTVKANSLGSLGSS